MPKFETKQLRVRIPSEVYHKIEREADIRCLPIAAFLSILVETYFDVKRQGQVEREAKEAALKPKPKKLTQAELKRQEEDQRYEEEMEQRKKEAARGAAILVERHNNPEKYMSQADKDWRAAQERNNAYKKGSLLDELGDILGSPVVVDLPPEDYFKIYGKHKPGHEPKSEPNPVRPKEEDDADWARAEEYLRKQDEAKRTRG